MRRILARKQIYLINIIIVLYIFLQEIYISNIFLQDFCKILFKYYFFQGSYRKSYHRYIPARLCTILIILARFLQELSHNLATSTIQQECSRSCRILHNLAESFCLGTVQFLQVALCIMLALIQLIIKPYVSNILNIFDGFVLQIMILVSLVPLIDSYDQNLLLSIAVILIALPLIAFAVMELFIHKNGIKEISGNIRHKPNSSTDHRNYLLMNNLALTSVKKLNR